MGSKPKGICQKIDKEKIKWRLKKKILEEEIWKVFLYETQWGGSKIMRNKKNQKNYWKRIKKSLHDKR